MYAAVAFKFFLNRHRNDHDYNRSMLNKRKHRGTSIAIRYSTHTEAAPFNGEEEEENEQANKQQRQKERNAKQQTNERTSIEIKLELAQ